MLIYMCTNHMQLQVVMYSDIDVTSSKITLLIGHVHKTVHATFTTHLYNQWPCSYHVLDPSSKHVGCETVCTIALFLLYPALQYRLQVTNAALVTFEQG